MLGHLISFLPKTSGLIFWKGEEVCGIDLVGMETSIRFSDYVLCTGYRTLAEEGKEFQAYNKCRHRMRGWKQCSHCRELDISRVYTRLDFTGFEEMEAEYVDQEFSVYVAQFGDSILKCGVTRSERVEERTHEQGADFWVELMRFSNGEDAYRAETELQQRFGLRNFVRNDTKLNLLTEHAISKKPLSKIAIEAKLAEIKSKIESDPGASGAGDLNNFVLCKSEIVENNYPVPESFEISHSIDGKVIGSKSRMLFYEKGGKNFLVPMYESLGRVFLLKEPTGP